MKASFKTVTIANHTGYGQAAEHMFSFMQKEGIEWIQDAPILFNFCMPPDYEFSDKTVGYTPWESTDVPKNWIAGLKAVDDLWSTSRWTASILAKKSGREVFVLPHGVDPIWLPEYHSPHARFTFAHMGEPAIRKGGDVVLQAWDKHFQYRKDCRLIFKAVGHTVARVKDSDGSIIGSAMAYDNVDLVTNIWTRERLLYFFQSEIDCLLYPTRGEGFGLIPFEAIAAGCPTIVPDGGGTSEFSDLAVPLTNHLWVHSNDSQQHPGLWMDHSLDELIWKMEYMMDNYDTECERAWDNAIVLHNKFNWQQLARKAMDRLALL